MLGLGEHVKEVGDWGTGLCPFKSFWDLRYM